MTTQMVSELKLLTPRHDNIDILSRILVEDVNNSVTIKRMS